MKTMKTPTDQFGNPIPDDLIVLLVIMPCELNESELKQVVDSDWYIADDAPDFILMSKDKLETICPWIKEFALPEESGVFSKKIHLIDKKLHRGGKMFYAEKKGE